jgi:UDP-glucose 4-epimerase
MLLITGGTGYIGSHSCVAHDLLIVDNLCNSDASGKPFPNKIVPRRAGNIAQCWAAPGLAKQRLKWEAIRGLQAMCDDTWHWQQTVAIKK